MKKALICGISGQDGAYLAQFLLEKGYEVYGTSRDAETTNLRNLHRIEIKENVKVESMSLNDFRSVLQVLLKVEPDEIYNLAGQTSVSLSFEQPVETTESISIGTLYLLEAIRFTKRQIKFYNACSSECFGEDLRLPADETTPFRPRSPYAVAKSAAYWQVANYREAYGMFACSGILFNHESPFRPERFVTKKVVASACRIASGSQEKLKMGNLSVKRDWGWAPEYVTAMWQMLCRDKPDDFVIATGESNSLKAFLNIAFSSVGLDWHDHVIHDPTLLRPIDLQVGKANPTKAREVLGWQATYKMKDVVRMMIEAEQQSMANSPS